MGLFGSFVHLNIALSNAAERMLPRHLSEDGNKCFLRDVLPAAVRKGDIVYDVGGGSRPFISLADKNLLNAVVHGLDIDAAELRAAPDGVYDRMVVHDLCTYEGDGLADVAVCQALLEHVPNTEGAIRALASIVRPGGKVFLFAPARNALFARLNMLLPERVKRAVLFRVFPEKAGGHDGFKAYYDRCIPSQVERLASKYKLRVEEKRIFWKSSYFSAFFPAYVFWRLYQAVAFLLIRDDASESFIYVFQRDGESSGR